MNAAQHRQATDARLSALEGLIGELLENNAKLTQAVTALAQQEPKEPEYIRVDPMDAQVGDRLGDSYLEIEAIDDECTTVKIGGTVDWDTFQSAASVGGLLRRVE